MWKFLLRNGEDEIGKMAKAVEIFKDSALHNKELEEEQVRQKLLSEATEKKVTGKGHCK